MRLKRILTGTGTAVIAAVLVCGVLTSCKGRTMENMQPTGDTVELTPDTIPADTLQ